MKTFLPPEWAVQECVQLTWPHADTDWADMLPEVEACYVNMAREIALREKLIIVARSVDEVCMLLMTRLHADVMGNVSYVEVPTNDTWARDHAFISLLGDEGRTLLDFRFNGWGQKFAANLDNQICRRMNEQNVLEGTYESHLDFILEGGSIESDGRGTILTTTECLLAPNRNEPMTQADIESYLLKTLHAKRVLWLDHGYLAGDDTDSHVDTLARLCPDNTIAYVQCTDPDDEHYAALKAMEEQLTTFRTLEGKPYRLVPLPMAAPVYDEDGQRLPATYANFLVINGAVLMPTYAQPDLDEKARQQLQLAFPNRKIIGIDCQTLIRQHGSLHCCTMQFPQFNSDNK